jgi:hypothetical protein
VEGSYKHNNEHSGFIKGEDYSLMKKEFIACSPGRCGNFSDCAVMRVTETRRCSNRTLCKSRTQENVQYFRVCKNKVTVSLFVSTET